MDRTKPHTVRAYAGYSGRKIAVQLVKQIGGDWGYTLPSGRRIVQLRDEHSGRGLGFVMDGHPSPAPFRTLVDACIASGEMAEEKS